jgi:hypothetical protein
MGIKLCQKNYRRGKYLLDVTYLSYVESHFPVIKSHKERFNIRARDVHEPNL